MLSVVACCYIVMLKKVIYWNTSLLCLFTDKYVKYIPWKYFSKDTINSHQADLKRQILASIAHQFSTSSDTSAAELCQLQLQEY